MPLKTIDQKCWQHSSKEITTWLLPTLLVRHTYLFVIQGYSNVNLPMVWWTHCATLDLCCPCQWAPILNFNIQCTVVQMLTSNRKKNKACQNSTRSESASYSWLAIDLGEQVKCLSLFRKTVYLEVFQKWLFSTIINKTEIFSTVWRGWG